MSKPESPEMKSFKVKEIPTTTEFKTRLFASNELVKNNSHAFFTLINIIITLCVPLQIAVTLFSNNFFPLSRFVLTVEISFG